MAVAVTVTLSSQIMLAQGWFDNGWAYRRTVTVPNPSVTDLTEFQVNITLNETNFNFTEALTDGSDIRITASDGITSIPFWIESWDQAGEAASIWIRIPSIPVSGTSVHVYYGNPDPSVTPPDPVETSSFRSIHKRSG